MFFPASAKYVLLAIFGHFFGSQNYLTTHHILMRCHTEIVTNKKKSFKKTDAATKYNYYKNNHKVT
jgi:hypothetical protein